MIQEQTFSFKRRTEPIQVLRACLALLIFLSHFESISKYYGNLSAPVFIFYTISGFVVMLSTRNEEKVKGFLKRRFIRLLPLYWALTIFTFVFAYIVPSFLSYQPTVFQLIQSMLCIPFSRETIVNSHTTMRPIVGPAHTLEVEIFFSVIFYICMRISHKNRGKIASGICLAFFAIGELFSIFKIHTGIDVFEFYITHNRSAWIYFFAGIVLFKIFNAAESKSISISLLKEYSIFSIICSAAIFITIFLLADVIYADYFYFLQAIAGFLLLFFLIMLSQYSIKMPKFLVLFGDISFSFYLVHYYIVHITEKLLHVHSFGFLLVVAVLSALAVSILVACASYYVFEKKLPKLLLRQTK